jgi:NACalpha-BTF3-like transcription factor
MVANILGSTNLNNLTDLEKLPELFENLGIELDNTALEKFINKIKDLGVAIETVDIKKMASAIQSMYDLYASIMSGEQGRDFTQEAYEALVKSNGDLADKFVQVGDVFKYVGGSIGELAEAFALESVRQTEIAKQQLSSQLQVSTALNTFDA